MAIITQQHSADRSEPSAVSPHDIMGKRGAPLAPTFATVQRTIAALEAENGRFPASPAVVKRAGGNPKICMQHYNRIAASRREPIRELSGRDGNLAAAVRACAEHFAAQERLALQRTISGLQKSLDEMESLLAEARQEAMQAHERAAVAEQTLKCRQAGEAWQGEVQALARQVAELAEQVQATRQHSERTEARLDALLAARDNSESRIRLAENRAEAEKARAEAALAELARLQARLEQEQKP